MSRLQRFELFPQLPYDIRALIWGFAFAPRMVDLREEEVFEEDSYGEEDDEDSEIEFDETLSEQTTRIEREKQLALYDVIETVPQNTGFQKRQTQLEDFGFSSAHPAPKLRRVLWGTMHDETRKSFLYSCSKFTALLHTCKESRELLKHLGYDLAFGTRTAPPQTWFNFKSDFLLLYWNYENPVSLTVDGGCWTIGQILPCDLRRVRKLALIWRQDERGLAKGVKMFGNLEELVLVMHDTRYWGRDCSRSYPYYTRDEDFEFVDKEIHKLLTLCECLCHQPSRQRLIKEYLNGVSSEELPHCVESEHLTEMLRMKRDEDVATGRESWSVPKLRIAWLMSRMRKRELYQQGGERMNVWVLPQNALSVTEGIPLRPPSLWSVRWADDIDARHDVEAVEAMEAAACSCRCHS